MIEVLKTSPNPAAHGVGTTSHWQGRLKPTASMYVCACVCVCVCVSVCLRACVYPEPNSVTETGLGELGLFSTGPCA